jgi:hypothetical protein
MQRFLVYLIQPGVVATGLWGTFLQVGIAFANSFNIAGAADAISKYGLEGQLASGGLIAALVGAYYSFSQRKTGRAVATGAGAVAGGISGTLGTAMTQAFGWTEVAAGTTPLINFSAVWAQLLAAVGGADTAGAEAMFDPAVLTTVFGTTAAGGGVGALLGRFVFGDGTRHHKKGRRAHAH